MRASITVLLVAISISVHSQMSFRFTPAHFSPLVTESPSGTYSVGLGFGIEPHENIYLSFDVLANLPALGLNADSYIIIQDNSGDIIGDGYGAYKSYGVFYKSSYTISGNEYNTVYLASGLAVRHITRYVEIDKYSIVSQGIHNSTKIILPLSFYIGYKAETDDFFSDIYLGLVSNILSEQPWTKPFKNEQNASSEVLGLTMIIGLTYCIGKG